jgi:hypothetical protein
MTDSVLSRCVSLYRCLSRNQRGSMLINLQRILRDAGQDGTRKEAAQGKG